MEKLGVLSLFSGIGGFDLGLERAKGFRTLAFCEINPFRRRVLSKHWPNIPIYRDVTNLSCGHLLADWIIPDVIVGGFPCQPFSTASHGRRVAEDLWPEMRRLVDECKPEFVIAENVQEAAVTNAAEDLRVLGYRTDQRRISAAEAGADHKRDRWWLVAHANPKSQLHSAIDAEMAKLPELCGGLWGATNYARAVRISSRISRGLDRSRIEALGDAVLPQIPEIIGRAILSSQEGDRT